MTELGVALGKARRIRLHPTGAGVEVCSLYPSHADALAAATGIRDLLAMTCLADNGQALTACEAAIEAAQLRA